MRLSFVVVVLFVALFFWQVFEYRADASPREVEIRKALPMDVSFEKIQARTQLNSIRQAMQMQVLIQNDNLSSAAQAHADYLVQNNESSHDETEGHSNFTGIQPVDRAFDAGYQSSYINENLSTKNNTAQSSVDGLFSAIYHRFAFLDPSIDEIGVGVTQNPTESEQSAFVYLMGNNKLNRLCTHENFRGVGKYIYKVCKESKHRIDEKLFRKAIDNNKRNNPQIILYPYDGQDEVPPAFYAEIPDPLPDHEVSGFPVSVEFNDFYFKEIELDSFKLFTEGGEEIDTVQLMDKNSDPHQRFTTNQFALFPLERLEYDSRYRAEIIYHSKNKKEVLSWHFRTQKPTEELYIITQKEESIKIKSNKSYLIYFRPIDPHDIVKNIQFPSIVVVQFTDNNTLKVTVMSDELDHFDIVSDTRILHVEIAH